MTASAHDLVELVIPTYRRPDFLVRAVDSALEETPFLVTVLDDNSPEPAAETLDIRGLNDQHDSRLRVIRNGLNLGASLNILRTLEVSRAPYTWPFTDDHVVPSGAAQEIVEAIGEHADAAILFWNRGLLDGESLNTRELADYIDLIERSRAAFCFTDVHFNRVLRTDVGRRYTRLDARFSHAQPMLGIQIAALADGLLLHMRGGGVAQAQPGAPRSWSTGYLERFRWTPTYLIQDADLRWRYRAVVARHFPWRATLIDATSQDSGSIDQTFALDAATLVTSSQMPLRLRAEARLALFLANTRAGRLFKNMIPSKRGDREKVGFDQATW